MMLRLRRDQNPATLHDVLAWQSAPLTSNRQITGGGGISCQHALWCSPVVQLAQKCNIWDVFLWPPTFSFTTHFPHLPRETQTQTHASQCVGRATQLTNTTSHPPPPRASQPNVNRARVPMQPIAVTGQAGLRRQHSTLTVASPPPVASRHT